MERNNGLRSILQLSWVYDLFHWLIGKPEAMKWLSKKLWKVESGMTVVDIGCGTAALRDTLPSDIHYIGFDPNFAYIETAKQRSDGVFVNGRMSEFLLSDIGKELENQVDVVICSGVLHHLEDAEIDEVLSGVVFLLKKGGRFSALEPAFLERQDVLSRWVMKRDRGENILLQGEWEAKLKKYFPKAEVRVVNRLVRIPYVCGLMSAWKSEGSDC
jgi:SAM-dependent methyltransferase